MKMARHRLSWYWLSVLVLCVVLFIQSSYPSIKTGLSFPLQDKLLHMIAYGVLAALFYRAGQATWPGRLSQRQLFWISVSFAGLYGLSDEIHQAFVPSRQFDYFDMLADFAGGILGTLGYMWIRKRLSGQS